MKRYEVIWKEKPTEYQKEHFSKYEYAIQFYYDTLENFSDDVMLYDCITDKIVRCSRTKKHRKV